jgi:class 3 adenylate cyclase
MSLKFAGPGETFGFSARSRPPQMILLAHQLQRVVSAFATPKGVKIQLRAGIDAGPAVGAVVGKIRRFYCLYGDTLNTAARCCDAATPGTIWCTERCESAIPSREGITC